MDSNGLVPLGARVLVKQLAADDQTEGGIIIPQSSQERPPEGEIMAVGPKCEQLEVGQIVIFRKWSSKAFTVDGEDGCELIVMEESDALALRI
jgi:chaperonin GroES